jgi:hypothetical protein
VLFFAAVLLAMVFFAVGFLAAGMGLSPGGGDILLMPTFLP